MSRYESLSRHLDKQAGSVWQAKFEDIERILGFSLPASAYRYPAWWANQRGEGHTQVRGWRDAGWRTSGLDLENRSVCFEREQRPVDALETIDAKESLWERARASTGLQDRESLIAEGLKALIAKGAGERLIAMGGTMPEFLPAPRERPDS